LAHRALARVTEDIEKLHFNVMCGGDLRVRQRLGGGDRRNQVRGGGAPDFRILVQLFNPMMPHLAEECWAVLGHRTLVAEAPWPQVEHDLLIEDTQTLPVQVNGKKRAEVTVGRNAANTEIEAAVLALDAVKRVLDGKAPKKVIVVPQRIVNVVA
jgi:leucyl-tRNA synthetase